MGEAADSRKYALNTVFRPQTPLKAQGITRILLVMLHCNITADPGPFQRSPLKPHLGELHDDR